MKYTLYFFAFLSTVLAKTVYIIPIQGTIDLGLPPFIERVISEAEEKNADGMIILWHWLENSKKTRISENKIVGDQLTEDIERFQNHRLKTDSRRGKPASPATINRNVANFRAMLNKAVDYCNIFMINIYDKNDIR